MQTCTGNSSAEFHAFVPLKLPQSPFSISRRMMGISISLRTSLTYQILNKKILKPTSLHNLGSKVLIFQISYMKLSRVSSNPVLRISNEDDSTHQRQGPPVTAAFLCPPCTSPVLLFAPELPEPSRTWPLDSRQGKTLAWKTLSHFGHGYFVCLVLIFVWLVHQKIEFERALDGLQS